MKAKGRDHGRWKHGLFVGLTEYRYGPPEDARPITLAGPKKHVPIFRGEKRTHAVNRALDVMRDWRQSPFEHEGPVRAGIRSALCLAGHGWHRSDQQAAEIVAEALRLMGAKRPTWEQGQRHYVEPRENCKWCGIELEPGDMVAGFCSEEHARFARQHWGFETRSIADAAFSAVDRAMRRLAQKPRKCEECGTKFRPQREGSDQRFCSLQCSAAHRAKETPPRPCDHCGTVFTPHFGRMNLDQRFCSKKCAYEHRAYERFDRTCACCGAPFVTSSHKALYCSMRCAQIVSGFRTGRNLPKRVSGPVLDYLFRRQGLRITSEVRLAA